MPTPYKMYAARELPANPEIVDVDGVPHVRIKERGRSGLFKLAKNGRKYLCPSKRWYFDLRKADGTVERIKGEADKRATETLAAEMERDAARIRAGFTSPNLIEAKRPLADHLEDYETYLQGKNNTAAHITQTISRIKAMFNGCGFVFHSDVDATKATHWLNALRSNGKQLAIPPGEYFTPAQTAQLLGVTMTAVRASIRRLNLQAAGNGKRRTYPRATVAALAENRTKGAGAETANHYVRAVRGFYTWLVTVPMKGGLNPLETLNLIDVTEADKRRTRRELDAGQLQRLFRATMESRRTFRGLTGIDRYHLYLMASATGFRANALANLTPDDFDEMDTAAPFVILPARFAKNRKTKEQPLPLDVAGELRQYLADKPAGKPIWGGSWAKDHRGAEMLRGDLAAAGIPYEVQGPNGPEYHDFHCLRHSFLTLGGRAGIDLRTLQALAGHSKPELTARYSHRRLHDLTGAVGKLPDLVPSQPTPAVNLQPFKMTGTDAQNAVVPAVVNAVVTGGIPVHFNAPTFTSEQKNKTPIGLTQPLEIKGAGAFLHRPASNHINEDDGSRTRNHRIDSHEIPYSKNISCNDLGNANGSCCSARCSDIHIANILSIQSGPANSDSKPTEPLPPSLLSELVRIVKAWPQLPEPLRRGILAMIDAAAPQQSEGGTVTN